MCVVDHELPFKSAFGEETSRAMSPPNCEVGA
jgi:hypothetical protein